jgi:DNA-binding protein HU-beta
VNKRELVDAIVEKLGPETSRKAVEDTVNAFTETVGETLKKGDTVSLVGFGTFKTSKRAARTARNPQTGEPVKVPAATVPRFSAGQGLKDTVATGRGARKAAGKKATVKKAAGKKAAGKKATAKKATAKKATAKKATAKKATGKKATGKKATAKKR